MAAPVYIYHPDMILKPLISKSVAGKKGMLPLNAINGFRVGFKWIFRSVRNIKPPTVPEWRWVDFFVVGHHHQPLKIYDVLYIIREQRVQGLGVA